MKVNLDYYKEVEDLKQIGEEYEEVLQRVENCEGEDFSKIPLQAPIFMVY